MSETRGTLFWNICRVIDAAAPAMVVLENVRNLAGPRHRDTWETIIRSLRGLGYAVPDEPTVFSPHWLPPALQGTPQVRERVFIVAFRSGSAAPSELVLPTPLVRGPVAGWDPMRWDLETDLPLQDDEAIKGLDRYRLSSDEERWIDLWDDLIGRLDCAKLPGFPIWADAFIGDLAVPPGTPKWKGDFLRKNAAFYREHQATIDGWFERHDYLEGVPASRRKLEWQAQDTPRSLRNCFLHFRPSGIRAKKPTYVPALVAITQTSVIGPRGRRLTPREGARLQGFPEWFTFGDQADPHSYRQLGNAIAMPALLYVLGAAVRTARHLAPDFTAGWGEASLAERLVAA